MGTLLFNRVLNGVLNGISTSTCSIPKRFDSQPNGNCGMQLEDNWETTSGRQVADN